MPTTEPVVVIFCFEACLYRLSAKNSARTAFSRPEQMSFVVIVSKPPTECVRNTLRQEFTLSYWNEGNEIVVNYTWLKHIKEKIYIKSLKLNYKYMHQLDWLIEIKCEGITQKKFSQYFARKCVRVRQLNLIGLLKWLQLWEYDILNARACYEIFSNIFIVY